MTRNLTDVSPKLRNLPNCKVVDGPKSLNEGRNLGASRLDTDLIAFIDDDNSLDKRALDEMANAFTLSEDIGVVSPVIFDQHGDVWFAGVNWTSFGMSKFDRTIPSGLRPTEVFHDVFMVRREAFEKAGRFNPELFPFFLGEADLAERMRRLGFRFVVAPKARVWHHIGKGRARGSHIRTKERAYLVGRNRLIFLKLYYPRRFFLHLFILPFLMAYHLRSMEPSFRREYLRGVRDGF